MCSFTGFRITIFANSSLHFGNTPEYTSYVVGYASRSLGVCTIYTRVHLFTVLAKTGAKLEWSIGMDFYSPYF